MPSLATTPARWATQHTPCLNSITHLLVLCADEEFEFGKHTGFMGGAALAAVQALAAGLADRIVSFFLCEGETPPRVVPALCTGS